MGKLSTHVLDTMHGVPANDVLIELYAVDGNSRSLKASVRSNADGRCPGALLEGEALQRGTYELVFHAGDYFAARGVTLPEPRFVDKVSVCFGIAQANENYHVPLLVSPWAWSTYRGS